MKNSNSIISIGLIIGMLLSPQCKGQDSATYCLSNEMMVSSCYTFYKDSNYTFKMVSSTDDMTMNFATGIYKETKGRIIVKSGKGIQVQCRYTNGIFICDSSAIKSSFNIKRQVFYKDGLQKLKHIRPGQFRRLYDSSHKLYWLKQKVLVFEKEKSMP